MSQVVPWSPRKKLLVGVTAGTSAGAAGYLVYRYWLKGYLEQRWGAAYKSASALWGVMETAGLASEVSATVLTDLKAFLDSDADDVPRSVRQMLKLSRSPEFQQAVLCSAQSVTEGVAVGVIRSTKQEGECQGAQSTAGRGPQKGVVEVVLEKLFTEEGKGFASAVCSRMVRTLVASLQSKGRGESPRGDSPGQSSSDHTQNQQLQQQQQQSTWMVQLVDVLSTNRGKDLLTTVIRAFAIDGIGTYLDKTADINMYHDILSACGRNQAVVKDLSSHVIATTVREAVHSWRAAPPRPEEHATVSEASSSSCSSPRAGLIPMSAFSESDSDTTQVRRDVKASGIAAEVAQCLGQPEVRSMILDVTGVITTRGMEAFLLVLMYKMFGGSPPHLPQIEEACAGGAQLHSYSGISRDPRGVKIGRLHSRTLAVASVCLALILHQMSMYC